MGGGGSKGQQTAEDRYFSRIEQELVRSTIPRGLSDEKAKELKYQLHWCLSKNDWYFTIGGLVVGGLATYLSRSLKPFAAAAVISPALDWAYGRHVCAKYEEAYVEYKRQLTEQYREQAEEIRHQVRGTSSGIGSGQRSQ